jgi:hypothetical protein
MTSDDRIDQLRAIHEIRQLAYRYAYAADTRDWDLMYSLWVDPCCSRSWSLARSGITCRLEVLSSGR